IEGIFTKAFRTGLQPVQLATRILKEMDAGKTVGVREVWVPNHYSFTMSEPDGQKFHQTEKALRRELEQGVREGASERGWSFVGPTMVEFQTDGSFKQGDFACQAALVEGPTTGQPPLAGRPSEQDSAAELVVIEKGRSRESFPLSKERVIIGRMAESDVVVPD